MHIYFAFFIEENRLKHPKLKYVKKKFHTNFRHSENISPPKKNLNKVFGFKGLVNHLKPNLMGEKTVKLTQNSNSSAEKF